MDTYAVHSPAKMDYLRQLTPSICVNSALKAMPPKVAIKAASLLFSLRPHRLSVLPELARLSLQAQLFPRSQCAFPRWDAAENKPKGLSGVAANVAPTDALEGYADGFFLFSHLGPLKWWAPEQRMVLFFDETHVEKNTRRLLRNGRFKVTFDTAFSDVMNGCAALRMGRPPLTWITHRMKSLFQALHEQGHAHSVEVWNQKSELVGGLYGLAVGNVFFTESQFHRERDTSKVAFAVLNAHLSQWGFVMNDGKHHTSYLAANGFRLISRTDFNRITGEFARSSRKPGRWFTDGKFDLDEWVTERPSRISGATIAPHETTTDKIKQIVKF